HVNLKDDPITVVVVRRIIVLPHHNFIGNYVMQSVLAVKRFDLVVGNPAGPAGQRVPAIAAPSRSSACSELSSLLSHSCALFCMRRKTNSFIFKQFRTLCTKHRGMVDGEQIVSGE